MTWGASRAWPAWRWALLAALLGHALVWVVWHQRGGQASDQHGAGLPLRVRFQTLRVAAVPAAMAAPRMTETGSSRRVAPQQPGAGVQAGATPRDAQAALSVEAPRAASDTQAAAAGDPLDALQLDPSVYLSADSVDVPPQLVGEWRVNDQAVPRGGGRPKQVQVAVRLWVSPEGRIDAYQVVGVAPEVPWVDSLLEPLGLSTLLPAHHAGRSVASSWLVELTLDLSGGL